ncbi:MAG: Gfo/Idh/MocA family oxidoreductase [Defluviitaleaceae bacterium]|nr:Gfo/Idh/MocA family oxidoreductase [Defluviitaleaceae bacterium]
MAIKTDAVLNQFKKEEEKATIKTNKILKVGIIGTGWIAEYHAESLKQMPDVKITAAADLVPGKAENFCKAQNLKGVNCYPSHKEMLDTEALDAVSICTYNTTHAECTIYALKKGIHVLLEKPMCVTTTEALAIIEAEKCCGKLLSIGFQPRFDPNMQKIKEIVESGTLGKVYYIQTGGGRRRGIPGGTFIEKSTGGIGALGDIGCYSLDMVLNAIGYPRPISISGYTSDYFGTNPDYNGNDAARFSVDDFAAAFIRLEGGIVLDFRISWAMHIDTPGDTLILGTKAALRIPSTDCWNGSPGGPMTLYTDVAGIQVQTQIPMLEEDPNGLFYQKIRSFLDAIHTGGPAPVPSSQILHNQMIIDGIVKSAAMGREITF